MANENLAIDNNMRNTLGAVTNDGSQEIRRVRVNPVTGAMLVEANITSSNTSIGSTIPGATEGSVLFAGPGGTLDQDNTNFFWDDTTNSLGIQTNSPGANLDIQGDAIITGDAGTADELLGRDSGTGQISGVTVGSGLDLTAGVLTSTGGGSGGYDTIQNNGVSVTQRSTINLSTLLTATDSGGKTALTINVTNLANDSTFLSNLDLSDIGGQINLATQVSGTLPVGNGGTGASTLTGILVGNGTSAVTATTITQGNIFYGSASNALTALAKDTNATRYLSNQGTSNNPSWGQVNLANGVTGLLPGGNINQGTLNLSTIGGQINLTTQVSGILPLVNGGTGQNLSDPGANKLLAWDDTDNTVGFWTVGSGLSYDHSTHTLSSTGSGSDQKVGVGSSTNTVWFNFQPLFEQPNTNTGHKEVWSLPSATYGPMSTSIGSGNNVHAPNTIAYLFYNFTSQGQYSFSGSNKKKIVVEGVCIIGTDVQDCGWGISYATDIIRPVPTNAQGFGFIQSGGTWYAYVGDGSSHTKTAVTAANATRIFRIEFNPLIPSVLFYIDGSLVATITTNLPASAGGSVGFTAGNNTQNGIIVVGCPSFSVEI